MTRSRTTEPEVTRDAPPDISKLHDPPTRPTRRPMPPPPQVTAIRLHRRGEAPLVLSLKATRSSTILIGRGENIELRVKDSGISRIHGFLRCDEQQWVYVDVGSANGSWVDHVDGRVRLVPGQAVMLQPDDKVYLASGSTFIEALDAMPPSDVNAGTRSAAGRQFESHVATAATSHLPVFLLGPSGAGKTWAAEVLHRHSGRRGRYIAINCAGLPSDPNQLKSELLGHTRGAFTGADVAKVGAFFAADGGTLFLDEVESLSREAQGFLLHLLEDSGQLLPLGASNTAEPRRPKVCVVSASKRPLRLTELRTDLTHRLASGELIQVPSLRERADDIPGLVERFRLEDPAAAGVTFAREALDVIIKAPWEGEIRELRSTILLLVDRAKRSGRVVDADAVSERLESLRMSHGIAPSPRSHFGDDDDDQTHFDSLRRRPTVELRLPSQSQRDAGPLLPAPAPSPTLDKLSSRRASADDIAEALRLTGGNIDRAATVLGWSRNTLTKKMDEFGLRLRPPRPPRADDAS